MVDWRDDSDAVMINFNSPASVLERSTVACQNACVLYAEIYPTKKALDYTYRWYAHLAEVISREFRLLLLASSCT